MFGQLVVRLFQREEPILLWQRIVGLSSVVLEADDRGSEHAVTCVECPDSPRVVWFYFSQGLLKNWHVEQKK